MPRHLPQIGQFVLDFFSPAAPKNPTKNIATQADLTAQTAEKPLKKSPPEALIHPQATHRIALGGQLLAYQLVRSPRRSVGFVIDPQGLQVRAHPRVPLGEIERMLQARSAWVLKHWHAQQAQQAQQAPEVWADGSSQRLHGQALRLQLQPTLPRGQHQLQGDGQTLALALPAQASAEQIQSAALAWYGRYAHAHFCQRLNHYAPAMGVRWTQLKLSNARTRWGSAKADGSIRLHWRLVQLAPDLLDYVVVHELAHLREMNHSPRFWAIVAQHCPNYRSLRAQLKAEQL